MNRITIGVGTTTNRCVALINCKLNLINLFQLSLKIYKYNITRNYYIVRRAFILIYN